MKPGNVNELYDRLKAMIMRGEIRANERIVEQNLAERFGLSRTPVREVLTRLVNEGLLIAIPNLGTFVRQYSYQEVDEVFEIRAELEALAARMAAARIDAHGVAELRDTAGLIEEKRRNGAWREAYELDQKFHHLIALHSGNSMLVKTLENFDCKVTCIYANLARPDWNKNEDIVRVSHQAIAEAIADHNPAAAGELIKQHIAWARSTLTR